jgi:hypothetical protein
MNQPFDPTLRLQAGQSIRSRVWCFGQWNTFGSWWLRCQ